MSKTFLWSAFVYFVIVFGYILLILSETDFYYTYFLDDTYIHLSVAKNFAEHGIWGMTRYEISSSSSSPLYTFLLSFFIYVFGNNAFIPLYFNIVIGVLVLYFLDQFFRTYYHQTKEILFCVWFTFLFSLMYVQVLSGMEHTLQCLVFVLNIIYFKKWEQTDFSWNKNALFFLISLSCTGLLRFESMFYFAGLSFFFIMLKKLKQSIAILISGFLPILIFCYFNERLTGYYFPFSVLVKGTQFNLNSELFSQIQSILYNNFLINRSFYKLAVLPLLISGVFIYQEYKKSNLWNSIKQNILLISVGIAMLLQFFFGELRSSFRYEAYIMVMYCMILLPKLSFLFKENWLSLFKKQPILMFGIAFSIVTAFYKIGYSHIILHYGGKNIYEQQIQSARFLHQYYNTSKVVANDIGAICYFTDIQLLDYIGLGSGNMIPYTRNNKAFDQEFKNYISQYSKQNNFELAIIYDAWLHPYIPEDWKRVSTLKIKKRITAGKDSVSIFSIRREQENSLRKNIESFQWQRNVEVKILK